MLTHLGTPSAEKRRSPSSGLRQLVRAIAALLLALWSSLPARADVPDECKIDATAETTSLYVGQQGSDCEGLLVISQTVFDAVGSLDRNSNSNESFEVTIDGYDDAFGVSDWYTGNITDMSNYFRGTNIGDGSSSDPIGDISNWDVSQVTDMSYVFFNAHTFNQDLSEWDVSQVTNMSRMFYNAYEFNGNISAWNVSQVEDMSSMFYNAEAFNQELNSWDISEVTEMKSMFSGAMSFDKDLSSWNVSQVTDMFALFREASAFNQDLSDWDVSQVTNMAYMFESASAFNTPLYWGDKTRNVERMDQMFKYALNFQGGGLADWNTSSLTQVAEMFFGAQSFNEDIGEWDVSNVTRNYDMFNGATSFNQDIGDWDVRNFGSMIRMFQDAASFNQDIGDWDVRNIAVMHGMFRDAVQFNGDISNWNVSSVTNMTNMFEGASNFYQDLSNWPVGYFSEEPSNFNTDANESWRSNSGMQPNWGGIDATNPTIDTLYPESGEVGVDAGVVLRVTFSEGIDEGSGSIEIFDQDHAPFATIGVSDSEVEFVGASLVLTPQTAFTPGETYYVTISEGAVIDNSQQENPFAGIADEQTWRFSIKTEVDADASMVSVLPSDTPIDLTSSATVQVTAIDISGNPVSGQVDDLSATVSNGAQLGDFVETGAGVYEAELTSTYAGTADVIVTMDGVTLSQAVSVTFLESIIVSASTSTLEIDEGSTSAFTLSLASQPSVALEVTATSSNSVAVGVSADEGDLPGETATFIFEPNNWNTPQTALVTDLVNETSDDDVRISFGLKIWSDATQSYEDSDPSLTSVTVPDDVSVSLVKTPGAPAQVRVTPDDQSLTLAWKAPTDNGGADIVGYAYSLDGGDTYSDMSLTLDGGDYEYTITGSDAVPINGAAFSVSLRAENRIGLGDPSGAIVVPSVTLAAGGDEPVSAAFAVTATFSADVTGLGADDLGLENGTLSGSLSWSETDVAKVYTFEVQPDDALEGQVTVNMAAGAATLASDGVTGNTQALTLTVAVDTKGPVFTSGDSFTVSENSSSVGTLTAKDGEDGSGGVDYAITGGVDAANFAIDASTGELSFDIDGAAADFESPADDDQDNDYQLEVTATDGTGNATTQAVTVTVANVVEAAALAVEASGLDLLLETSALNLDEGQSGEVVLTLLEQPTDQVTLLVEVDDPDAAQILVSQDGATTTAQTTELIFELASWDTPQSLWIEAVDRTTALDPISTEVSLSFANSTDTGYQALEASSFTVNAANTTAPSLDVSVTELTVGEGDSQDFKVVLNAQPTGLVLVTVSTDDVDAASVSSDGGASQAASVDLTFNQSTWALEQTIRVTGVEDDDTDDETPLITMTPSGGGYDSDATASVGVTVTDTSVKGLTISRDSLAINERGDGNSETFSVVLDTIPSGDVMVTVASSDDGAASVSEDEGMTQAASVELRFTQTSWNVPQTLTVTAVEDDDTNDESPSISLTPIGGGYDTDLTGAVSVTVADTDKAGVAVSTSLISIQESGDGNSGTFEVVLNTIPTDDVKVTLASDDFGAVSLSSDGGVNEAETIELTFTATDWNLPQTLTVTGVEDDDTDDEDLSISLSPSGGDYSEVTAGSVAVKVTDTSAKGLLISQDSISVNESGVGNSATFTVALNTIPSGDVKVTVQSDDSGAASLSSDGGVNEAETIELTFTATDWNLPQTLTVTGVEDDDTDDEDLSIGLSPSGGDYSDVTAGSVAVKVTDTSVKGLLISQDSISVNESGVGNSATFTVALNTIPRGDVKVTVQSNDFGAASLSSDGGVNESETIELTFTATDWNLPQTLTVTGVEDDDTDDEDLSISLSPSGGDYSEVTAGSVAVKVTDTSVKGLLISQDSISVNESGVGNSATFTVALKAIPSGDVKVTVWSDDFGAASLSSDGGVNEAETIELTFTATDWNLPQTLTVTGVEDDDTDDEDLSISLSPSGGDYSDLMAGSVAVKVTDTSVKGLLISQDSISVNESGVGNSATFTVALNTIPSGDVKVTVQSNDFGAASLSSDGGVNESETIELTFTATDWNLPQTLAVTGVEDDDTDDEDLSIGLSPSGGDYSEVTAGSVAVKVTDTSVKGLLVSQDSISVNESGVGNSATFTVALNTIPSGDVKVTVQSDDSGAASLSSDGGVNEAETIELTFTATDWNLPQTLTVTGVEDDDTDDEDLSISLSPSGGDYSEVTAGSVAVKVTDTSVKGLLISKESISITESGDENSATFTVVLDTIPSGDVTVTVRSSDGEVASISEDEGTTQAASVDLTFTAENWDAPQTVTVTAVDNSTLGAGSATLSFVTSSVDPAYEALDVPSIPVAIDDDESATLVISASSLTLDEGGTATFTVALGALPSDQVTVIPGSSDTGVLTVAESSLTFDATNWDAVQSVTLAAPENTSFGNTTAEVSLVAAGAEFGGGSAKVQVLIVDNDDQTPYEDTGAIVSSISASEVMGSQLGDLISDAVRAGVSATGPGSDVRLDLQDVPTQPGRTLYGYTAADYDPEAYNRLHVLSAREGAGGFTLVDWFSVGLSQASLDANLLGDGAFAYALVGRELTKTAGRVGGLLYGVETSTWDYEGETDVDRTGVSLGYYSAQKRNGLTFSGSAIFTLSQNDFVSESGATGDAASQRWIFKGGISGEHTLERRRGILKPYVSLMYATENLESFTFSDGLTSDGSTAEIGELGLGMEYTTLPTASGDRFLVRGELSQVFGTDSVTLSNGDVYSPNEDPVGSVTFGWITQPGTDTSAQIELTFGELGNSEREEIRLDGTVDRRF